MDKNKYEMISCNISRTKAIVDNREVRIEFNFHITRNLCRMFNVSSAKEALEVIGQPLTQFAERVSKIRTNSNNKISPIYSAYKVLYNDVLRDITFFAFFTSSAGKFSIEYCVVDDDVEFPLLLKNIGLEKLIETFDIGTWEDIDVETAEIMFNEIKLKRF